MEALVLGEERDLSTPKARSFVRELLSLTSIRVVFTKADGSDREMNCTTAPSLVPSDKVPKGTGKPHTEEVQRVFDLDIGEWRSFKWDAVKEIDA